MSTNHSADASTARVQTLKQTTLDLGATVKFETLNQLFERLKSTIQEIVTAELSLVLKTLQDAAVRLESEEPKKTTVHGLDLSPPEQFG